MLRTVSSQIALNALAPAQLVLSISIVDASNASEEIAVAQGDKALAVREILDQHGTGYTSWMLLPAPST